MTNPLPYQDTKPVGAADFYFAINATFRFIRETLGVAALHAYWGDLGREYMGLVSQRWKQGGLPAVAEYWRAFFAAEPGADVEVTITHGSSESGISAAEAMPSHQVNRENASLVVLNVKTCPAIRHLREGKRIIDPGFCQHCYYVSEAAAQAAGLTVRIKGGNGSCRQIFCFSGAEESPQNMEDIEKAS